MSIVDDEILNCILCAIVPRKRVRVLELQTVNVIAGTDLCSGGRGCALKRRRWKEAAAVWVWV